MNRAELKNQLERLFRGFGRDPDRQLTPEKFLAFHEHYQHMPGEVFENAVSSCLLDDRFPSRERLGAAIERCHEDWRARQTKRADDDARRALSGYRPEIPTAWGDEAVAAMREWADVCFASYDVDEREDQLEDRLDDVRANHPGVAMMERRA